MTINFTAYMSIYICIDYFEVGNQYDLIIQLSTVGEFVQFSIYLVFTNLLSFLGSMSLRMNYRNIFD